MIVRLARFLTGGGDAPSASFGVIPEGQRIYAVGDVHGRADLLIKLLNLLKHDASDFEGLVKLIFIGDYIDRGPDSAGVVKTLLTGLPREWEVVFLRGNHEQAMLDFLADPKRSSAWLSWGGIQALESYGVQPYGARGVRETPALAAELELALQEYQHMDFYRGTILSHVVGGYAFVHAGVRAGVPLESQMENDLLFIREDFIGRPHGLPYRVVFGHTIHSSPVIESDRIGIDTGAFQSGVLTAVALEGADVRVIQAS